ncbi:MAG: NUDIX hydrolase [Eubacterium sp.]|nr:NUDIX hydrolase [Eubacterium sp.]
MSDYKLIKSYPVHRGNVMDFFECEIGLPDGGVTHWDLIHHPGGAAVIPVDDEGKIIFVRQYRVGADEELLEIPAGKSDPGEDRLTTIKREMEEEIGYTSESFTKLMDFCPAPAYSEEKTAIFLARDLKKTDARPDSDEFVTIERYSPGEARDMISEGKITDGKTIAAVLAFCFSKEDF